MEMFLDQELLRQAEVVARELLASGGQQSTVEGSEGDSGRPQFHVSQSKEGMTVLRTLDVDGQEFYLGMDTGTV